MYVAQSKGFRDLVHPQHVNKLNKALHGLKQALRTWYECLTIYLIHKGYAREGTNKTLFVNKSDKDIIVAQIYVDDTIFGRFPEEIVGNFIHIMQSSLR